MKVDAGIADCPICFKTMAQGNGHVATLTCGHRFHFLCNSAWWKGKRQGTCALCRGRVSVVNSVQPSTDKVESYVRPSVPPARSQPPSTLRSSLGAARALIKAVPVITLLKVGVAAATAGIAYYYLMPEVEYASNRTILGPGEPYYVCEAEDVCTTVCPNGIGHAVKVLVGAGDSCSTFCRTMLSHCFYSTSEHFSDYVLPTIKHTGSSLLGPAEPDYICESEPICTTVCPETIPNAVRGLLGFGQSCTEFCRDMQHSCYYDN